MAGWFYPPPPPVIGGAASGGQPYDPGLRVTPPQAPPNPPFAHPAIRDAVNFGIILASWEPPPPVPTQQWAGNRAPYSIPPPPPNPPFGHPARLRPSDAIVLQWWQPGPQPSQVLLPLVQGTVPVAQVPFSRSWLDTVLQAWQAGPYQTPLPGPLPQPFVAADNPPRYSIVTQLQILQSWQPAPPQPYQLVQYAPIPAAQVDQPPVKGTDWLDSVLQSWQPAPPLPVQLLQNVVQEGPFVPPPPPAEEGAQPVGRAWWGYESFDGSRRPWWYKDLRDKARELERQRKLRIELGILPADTAEEAQSVAEEVLEFIEETPSPATADYYIARAEQMAERIEKIVEEMNEIDDEEMAAVQIAHLLFTRKF